MTLDELIADLQELKFRFDGSLEVFDKDGIPLDIATVQGRFMHGKAYASTEQRNEEPQTPVVIIY